MGKLLDLQPRRPDRAIHGYLYYRWTTAYMTVVRYVLDRPYLGALRRAAGRHLEQTHHAKVVPTEEARRVLRLDRAIDWRDLESAVPFAVARDIILDAPTRIALAECACRAVAERSGQRDGHCGPLDVCLYVGDPIASFVVEKQETARFVTAEEALAVVEAAAQRGDVHTLWFKDAADGRMYALCNCCSCCCIGLKSLRAGFHPLASSGYVAEVEDERCTGCGRCVEACAFGAIALEGKGSAVATVDSDACVGCGVCAGTCPASAIRLVETDHGATALPWPAEEDAAPGS